MFELNAEVKSILDIGLGALSLMLWLRQGKINKAQVALDEKQNKSTEDLTLMVKEHAERIKSLEHTSVNLLKSVRKTNAAIKGKKR